MQHILTDKEYQLLQEKANLADKTIDELTEIMKSRITEQDKCFQKSWEEEIARRLRLEEKYTKLNIEKIKIASLYRELAIWHNRLINSVKEYNRLNCFERLLKELIVPDKEMEYVHLIEE